jgi:exopolysaccharide biosynthesis polyprenyl glycosylphosphotransferase
LSLVVIRAEPERGGGYAVVTDLLDLLNRNKRETDTLGQLGKDRVGIMLPDTNEDGMEAFTRNVSGAIAHLPVSMISGTYPGHLFENLLNEGREPTETLAYFLEEHVELSGTTAFAKRVIDVVGALAALVVFSPIMIATAIAVAVTSPGPVIFRQKRLGKGGVPFTFYKFRSMRAGADDRIHREYTASLIEGKLDNVNQGDKDRPLYKMSADPRITNVGRLIRKTSVDELPQIFNVLKGDMSLVGPRPPLPYEAEKYQSWHLRRVLEIRPGITGLWQVEGRSTTSFDDMVRLDLRYIRECSIWLDLKILLKTVLVVLRRDGAG